MACKVLWPSQHTSIVQKSSWNGIRPFVSFWNIRTVLGKCAASGSKHCLFYWSFFYFSNSSHCSTFMFPYHTSQQHASKSDILNVFIFVLRIIQQACTEQQLSQRSTTQATSILTKMTSGGLTDNLLFKSQCNLMDLSTEDKYSISFAGKKRSWHPGLHVNAGRLDLLQSQVSLGKHTIITADFHVCIPRGIFQYLHLNQPIVWFTSK